MNREEKIKELENTLDKCIKDLESLKQPEFKDGDKVNVCEHEWSTDTFDCYGNAVTVFCRFCDKTKQM